MNIHDLQAEAHLGPASQSQQPKPAAQGVGLLAQVRTAAHSDRVATPAGKVINDVLPPLTCEYPCLKP